MELELVSRARYSVGPEASVGQGDGSGSWVSYGRMDKDRGVDGPAPTKTTNDPAIKSSSFIHQDDDVGWMGCMHACMEPDGGGMVDDGVVQ
jgi:hypothetical protein